VRDPEETCRSFLQIWAEAVMRQVERVRAIRKRSHSIGRAYERGFGPDELDLAQIAREQWAEEHSLVWAAYQVERWTQRLAEERGDDPPPRDEVLANVRNALEHLDEAEFEGSHAVPGLSGNRSLRKLPGERLPLFTGYNGLAFGLIDPGELERRALGVVATIEDELMERAADWWADMNSGR
jgi:hypothetical protein